MRLALFAAAATLIAACAAPATGPRVANNPCNDPAHRALKAQPVDSLSTREYEQMQAGDAACAEVTRLLAANANDNANRPPARLETDGYLQALQSGEGSEVFIRNRSNVPIIVTEVTLTNCIAIADPCSTYNPRTRINPGDSRRVLRVRYQTGTMTSSFRWSWRVEPADMGSRD
jgi:hypothetical protein